MMRVADAQESLKLQFGEHKCEGDDASYAPPEKTFLQSPMVQLVGFRLGHATRVCYAPL